MDREWVRVLAAAALGMLLPQMIVTLGANRQPEEPEQTAQTTVCTTVPGETVWEYEEIFIPVLMEDGLVEMELEEYVRGVVLAEMPAYFEEEALKAQAVVARTYALRRVQRGDRHSGGAVCTVSSCCQNYMTDEKYLSGWGAQDDLQKVADAVEATAGLVLTYEGELIDSTYFSCSGGRTEDAAAVWGKDVPYLQAVDSPGEEEAGSFEKEVYIKKAAFAEKLGRTLKGSPTTWLGAVTYTDGGGVATMVIAGITYTGKELRTLLGLNSTAFTMVADEGGITVTTKGKGHRVGMSQYGADAMAAAGSGFAEILTYYYQGTVVDKISDLG